MATPTTDPCGPVKFPELALGRHLTVEYYDCDARILADTFLMRDIFTESALASGATVLESSFHAFHPQGVSGIVVISESHFAVHAWPEHDYAAVDIFTCGDRIDFQLAVDLLRRKLKSRSMIMSHAMSRGLIGADGAVVHDVGSAEVPEGVMSWRKRYDCAGAWGMLGSIDVYNCSGEVLTSEMLRQLTSGLAGCLGSQLKGECLIVPFHDPAKGDGLRLLQMLSDGTITGRMSCLRRAFYCDIFTNRFFEPREPAEYLMDVLRGGYYRLQVALRQ